MRSRNEALTKQFICHHVLLPQAVAMDTSNTVVSHGRSMIISYYFFWHQLYVGFLFFRLLCGRRIVSFLSCFFSFLFFLFRRDLHLVSFLFTKSDGVLGLLYRRRAPRHWDLVKIWIGTVFCFFLFFHDGYWEYYIWLG